MTAVTRAILKKLDPMIEAAAAIDQVARHLDDSNAETAVPRIVVEVGRIRDAMTDYSDATGLSFSALRLLNVPFKWQRFVPYLALTAVALAQGCDLAQRRVDGVADPNNFRRLPEPVLLVAGALYVQDVGSVYENYQRFFRPGVFGNRTEATLEALARKTVEIASEALGDWLSTNEQPAREVWA